MEPVDLKNLTGRKPRHIDISAADNHDNLPTAGLPPAGMAGSPSVSGPDNHPPKLLIDSLFIPYFSCKNLKCVKSSPNLEGFYAESIMGFTTRG